MTITLDQVLTFIGGGLFVFLLEQVVQHFRREKHLLGYAVDTRVIAERAHSDLKMTFRDMEVEKVFCHSILIRNIGNTCLKAFPVYIQTSGGKFYYATMQTKPGIECMRIEDAPCFAFSVSMLNPGDEVKVELTILDAPDQSLVVDARAEHLKVKDIAGSYSTADALDVVLESSSGFTWTLAKLLKVSITER